MKFLKWLFLICVAPPVVIGTLAHTSYQVFLFWDWVMK